MLTCCAYSWKTQKQNDACYENKLIIAYVSPIMDKAIC